MKKIYKILGIMIGMAAVPAVVVAFSCSTCLAKEESSKTRDLPRVQLVPSPPKVLNVPSPFEQPEPEQNEPVLT